MTRSLAIRLIYAACLIGATVNHAHVLIRHGLFWDYGGAPAASAAFWTLLTLLDPLAAILLLMRPNAGVTLTAAIIVADVVHNLWIVSRHTAPDAYIAALFGNPFVLCQIVFLIFVAVTLRYARVPRKNGLLKARNQ